MLTDSALPSLDLPSLSEDSETAIAAERLERGEIGMASFLSTLPPQHVSGRRVAIRPRLGVIARIRTLRGLGYRVALLTNTFRGFAGIRQSVGVPDDLFDLVVESWRVGLRKPDPAIFLLTADRLGLPATQCLFIDDKSVNIEAAAKLGFQVALSLGESELLTLLDDICGRESPPGTHGRD